jgi:hypothetical protein
MFFLIFMGFLAILYGICTFIRWLGDLIMCREVRRPKVKYDQNGRAYYADGLEHLTFGLAFADESAPERLVYPRGGNPQPPYRMPLGAVTERQGPLVRPVESPRYTMAGRTPQS